MDSKGTQAATAPARQMGNAPIPRETWVLAAFTVSVQILLGWQNVLHFFLFDPDDQLRLVQVRDFLAGQSWWDTTQYRINPADGGVMMHWSRLVDIPLIVVIMLLSPVVGQLMAEQLAAVLVPAMGLFLVFWVTARTCGMMGNRQLIIGALVLLATDALILFQLAPMRIDHHGWQIFLGGILLVNALSMPSLRNGIFGGIAAAALVSISLEGLPIIAMFVAISAGEWALTGRSAQRANFLGYVCALAIGSLILQFTLRGPAGLMEPWCDALSLPYLAAFSAAAMIAIIGSVIVRGNRDHKPARMMTVACAGAGALLALIAAAPQCSRGPFATLDPLVVRYWYSLVLEGLPLWRGGLVEACYVIAPSIIGLAGALGAIRAIRFDDDRRRWIILAIAIATMFLLSLLVLRTVSTAHLYALPGSAWLGLTLWGKARKLSNAALRVLASLASFIVIPPIAGIALASTIASLVSADGLAAEMAKSEASGSAMRSCIGSAEAATLNRQPASTIVAPLDIGPLMVVSTHHSVIATGHHRNNRAMAGTIATFVGPTSSARDRIERMEANVVALCEGANDLLSYQAASGVSFADDLVAGRPPVWLTPLPVPTGSRLRLWRVNSHDSARN